jgi:hypothetical protein
LSFYLQSNPVTERIYIGYNRTALSGEDALRVTLDTDIRFRLDRLDFTSGCGQMILPQGTALMEVKALGGLPLWLTRTLSENGVFPASFSKYGVCYTDYIMNPGFVPAREEAAKIA